MKTIIIAEKPSVAQEYAKVLGVTGREDGYIENDDYIITWTVGHLVTLCYPQEYDESLKSWNMETLPFLPEEYKYKVIKDVQGQFNVIKRLYHRSDVEKIMYAGDAGREGIYIQMLVREQAGVRPGIEERVIWIDSHTEREILRGIKEAKPLSHYVNMTAAGYMRAIEDYAFGINFSRALSVKYGRLYQSQSSTAENGVIHCGRVMSFVLGMVVEREKAIENFVSTDYYKPYANIRNEKGEISLEWKYQKESPVDTALLYEERGFLKKEDAETFVQALPQQMTVVSCEANEKKKYAPSLFNLAELQAACAKLFKIGPDKTLEIAQSLYEKKMTTYPRTDARVLSEAVAAEVGRNLSGLLEYDKLEDEIDKILDNEWHKGFAKKQYVDDSKVTDHYAIIPTGNIQEIDGLSHEEKAVFELICRRFISIFYPPAVYTEYNIEAKTGAELFASSEKLLVRKGYYEVVGVPASDEKEKNVEVYASIQQGEVIASVYEIKGKKTSPPSRFTSGSIVLAMENAGNLIEDEELRAQIKSDGIGTSATRGEIIKKLINLKYIMVNKKTQVLTPGENGYLVYDIMVDNLPDFLTAKMTASWEKGLSQIERGELTKDAYMQKLNYYIIKKVNEIKEKNDGNNYAGNYEEKETNFKCPLCKGSITYTKKYGYRCENRKTKDSPDGCGFHVGPICGILIGDRELKALLDGKPTERIKGFVNKEGKKFDAALAMKINREENKVELSFDFEHGKVDLKCPKCGSEVREGPKGFYCVNYKNGCTLSGLWKKPCWISGTLTANDIKKLLNGEEIEKSAKTKGGKSYKKKLYYDINAGEIKEKSSKKE